MKKDQKTTKELYEKIGPILKEIVERIGRDPHDPENRKVALLLGAMAMAAEATIPKSERADADREFEDMMARMRATPRGAF